MVRGFENVTGSKVKLPDRGTGQSAGYDFYAPCDIYIPAKGYSDLIPMGVKAYMHYNEVLLLFIRSSLGIKHKLSLANGTGVIDADYYNNPANEGNIGAMFHNNSDEDVVLPAGSRVMQGVFMCYETAFTDSVREEKRMGGYGSTGL